MTRAMIWSCMIGSLLLTAGCAESWHQGQRHTVWSHQYNAGYGSASVYGGAGYWWNPFGYYGPGYGWYGGSHHSSSAPAPRPTPPDNAPPQFQKKY